MTKIYIAGKMTEECKTPSGLRQCIKKFDDYGLKFLYPPNGDIIPYTICGFGYSTDNRDGVYHHDIKRGYTHGFIINSELLDSKSGSYEQYIKNDLTEMMKCDEVHFLPDWKESKGATFERSVAEFLNMKIIDVE